MNLYCQTCRCDVIPQNSFDKFVLFKFQCIQRAPNFTCLGPITFSQLFFIFENVGTVVVSWTLKNLHLSFLREKAQPRNLFFLLCLIPLQTFLFMLVARIYVSVL